MNVKTSGYVDNKSIFPLTSPFIKLKVKEVHTSYNRIERITRFITSFVNLKVIFMTLNPARTSEYGH